MEPQFPLPARLVKEYVFTDLTINGFGSLRFVNLKFGVRVPYLSAGYGYYGFPLEFPAVEWAVASLRAEPVCVNGPFLIHVYNCNVGIGACLQ